jgi:hypothetical protein
MRPGFTALDDGGAAVEGTDDGECAHAATHVHSAANKANGRTPVDTTETA